MIFIVDPDRRFRERITRSLEGSEFSELERLAGVEQVLAARNGKGGVLLIGPGIRTADSVRAAEDLASKLPHITVILVSDGMKPDMVQRVLRSGISDVLPSSFAIEELQDAITRAGRNGAQVSGSQDETDENWSTHEGSLITVFGPKGGAGKSFLAANLAVLMAKATGEPVALVDLDLEFGDMALMFQLFPAFTIEHAAQNIEKLDPDQLMSYLTPHNSGVTLLPAPLEPTIAETISAETVRTILSMLKRKFRYIVVDTPNSFTNQVLAALDLSDRAVMISTLDVPSLKNLKLALNALDLIGYPRERVLLALNRADSKVGLRVDGVEKTIGTQMHITIGSTIEVPLSINYGTPLAIKNPKSPIVASIARLLPMLITNPATKAATTKAHAVGRRR